MNRSDGADSLVIGQDGSRMPSGESVGVMGERSIKVSQCHISHMNSFWKFIVQKNAGEARNLHGQRNRRPLGRINGTRGTRLILDFISS